MSHLPLAIPTFMSVCHFMRALYLFWLLLLLGGVRMCRPASGSLQLQNQLLHFGAGCQTTLGGPFPWCCGSLCALQQVYLESLRKRQADLPEPMENCCVVAYMVVKALCYDLCLFAVARQEPKVGATNQLKLQFSLFALELARKVLGQMAPVPCFEHGAYYETLSHMYS